MKGVWRASEPPLDFFGIGTPHHNFGVVPELNSRGTRDV